MIRFRNWCFCGRSLADIAGSIIKGDNATGDTLVITDAIGTATDFTTYADLQGVEVLNLALGSTAKVTLDAAMTSVVIADNAATIETNANAQTVNANALTDGEVLTLTDTATSTATVTLVGGDLSASGYDGALTVTATTGTNVITTGAGNDTITGGAGADTIDVGGGANTVNFAVADAIGATVVLTVNTVALDDGDTFTGVFDTVASLASGDILDFLTLALVSEAADGSATAGKYQTIQGNYAAGVFTVDGTTGLDTLVLWNDGTNGDNAVVLTGITNLTGVTIA